MKSLPLGIQTFEKIVENNYVYVDKTQHIYGLLKGGCFFFARPRRFGKSLLCSTLNSIFNGNKEPFKGLWIDNKIRYDWPIHPVIHLDMSQVSRENSAVLHASLMRTLSVIAKDQEINLTACATPSEMLGTLTKELFKKFGSKNRVVLIIDEYDKPILDHIETIEIASEMREVLKNFYEAIKGLDKYLHLVFITGVTRFSKTSLFSGLNQLVNISMDPNFAHLVGYTEDEIRVYFSDHLQKIVEEIKIPITGGMDELFCMLRNWYDGYRFWRDPSLRTTAANNDELARLYTPFSVLNFLYTADFSNYWFESGTPSFLVKIFERYHYSIESFENLTADMNELMTFDIANIPLTTLLFQSGYMTIRGYNKDTQSYSLEMPNYEVRDSLLKCIMAAMTKQRISAITTTMIELRRTLETENLNSFIEGDLA